MASVAKEHHIVSGLALTITGIVGIIGSLTGSLGAMLDALFLTTNGVNKGLVSIPGNPAFSSNSSTSIGLLRPASPTNPTQPVSSATNLPSQVP